MRHICVVPKLIMIINHCQWINCQKNNDILRYSWFIPFPNVVSWHLASHYIYFSKLKNLLNPYRSYDIWNNCKECSKSIKTSCVGLWPIHLNFVIVKPFLEACIAVIDCVWCILIFLEITNTLIVPYIFEEYADCGNIEYNDEVSNNWQYN